jgi:hypothetical protein
MGVFILHAGKYREARRTTFQGPYKRVSMPVGTTCHLPWGLALPVNTCDLSTVATREDRDMNHQLDSSCTHAVSGSVEKARTW